MVSGYAALPANEGESVFDWIRRQNNPPKPQMPVVGVGLETYVFPSSLRPGREHDVYSADGAPWMVSPDMPIEMTIDETLAFISELQALRLFAQRLQDRRPLRRPAEVDERLREMDQ